MLKAITSSSYDTHGPAMSLVDIHSRGVDKAWMVKRSSVFIRELADLRPIHGRSFIHLIAMGADERYGGNRNGDAFPKTATMVEIPHPEDNPDRTGERLIKISCGLIERHPTFVKFGHVFSHHNNKDPKKASGIVHASAWNPEMDRVELIINVDNGKWEDKLQKLAGGHDQPFSMAAKVPWDCCKWCGHRARSRDEYCDHLRDGMTLITKEGHQVKCVNEKPTFFDISDVFRPADRIAFGFKKVASAEPMGSELAIEYGLMLPERLLAEDMDSRMRKRAEQLRKLSEIEKKIVAQAKASGPNSLTQITAPAIPEDGKLDEEKIAALRTDDLNKVLEKMSAYGICLGIEDFTRLVMGDGYKEAGAVVPAARSLLPTVFSDILAGSGSDDVIGDSTYEPSLGSVKLSTHSTLRAMYDRYSLFEMPAVQRATSGRRSLQSVGVEKFASDVVKKAHVLAREYAKYKLAFVTAHAENDAVVGLTVVQNSVQ